MNELMLAQKDLARLKKEVARRDHAIETEKITIKLLSAFDYDALKLFRFARTAVSCESDVLLLGDLLTACRRLDAPRWLILELYGAIAGLCEALNRTIVLFEEFPELPEHSSLINWRSDDQIFSEQVKLFLKAHPVFYN